MGKAKNGIFGAINGKVGPLVFYNLNGEEVVRTLGEKSSKLSHAQLVNCDKMALIVQLFSKIKPFIKAGFGNEAKGTNKNYHNIATAYNKAHAIELIDGKAVLNFQKVRLTQGLALSAEDARFEIGIAELKFIWAFDEDEHWESRNDQVMMMAYFPDEHDASFITSGARRRAKQDVLEIHPSFMQKRMEIYLSFVADDRQSVSTSVYLGRIN